MSTDPNKEDFRDPTALKRAPRAAVDGAAGMILAYADVAGTPEQVFQALTTDEVEKWWKFEGVYHQKDFKADPTVCGKWSVTVVLENGPEVKTWGEFCEFDRPGKIVMTRRFEVPTLESVKPPLHIGLNHLRTEP